jgi:hypothetical protein
MVCSLACSLAYSLVISRHLEPNRPSPPHVVHPRTVVLMVLLGAPFLAPTFHGPITRMPVGPLNKILICKLLSCVAVPPASLPSSHSASAFTAAAGCV